MKLRKNKCGSQLTSKQTSDHHRIALRHKYAAGIWSSQETLCQTKICDACRLVSSVSKDHYIIKVPKNGDNYYLSQIFDQRASLSACKRMVCEDRRVSRHCECGWQARDAERIWSGRCDGGRTQYLIHDDFINIFHDQRGH